MPGSWLSVTQPDTLPGVTETTAKLSNRDGGNYGPGGWNTVESG